MFNHERIHKNNFKILELWILDVFHYVNAKFVYFASDIEWDL